MKLFVATIALFCIFAAVESSPPPYGPAPLASLGKLGGGGPPCPKSVVVGCAPLVQSVPCKSGGGGGGMGGHVGAYSENYAQYAPQLAYTAPGNAYSAPTDYATSESTYVPQYYVPQYYVPQY